MEYEYIKHLDGTKLKLFLVEINHRELHFHNDVEIFIVLKGSVVVDHVKGRHALKQDDIFITNKNVVHSLKRTNEDNLLLVLQFNPDFCKEYYPEISRIRFRKCYVSKKSDGVYWDGLNRRIREIASCYAVKKEGYTIRTIALLNLLLLHMLEQDDYVALDEKEAASENRNILRLDMVINYLQDNYTRNVSLKGLAEEMNLDMFYLSHFIKGHLGIPFQSYVKRLRVERAEQLLLHTDLKNTDICLESGFSDYKYMSKAFLEEFQCTPAEYRKMNRGAAGELAEYNEQHTVMEAGGLFRL